MLILTLGMAKHAALLFKAFHAEFLHLMLMKVYGAVAFDDLVVKCSNHGFKTDKYRNLILKESLAYDHWKHGQQESGKEYRYTLGANGTVDQLFNLLRMKNVKAVETEDWQAYRSWLDNEIDARNKEWSDAQQAAIDLDLPAFYRGRLKFELEKSHNLDWFVQARSVFDAIAGHETSKASGAKGEGSPLNQALSTQAAERTRYGYQLFGRKSDLEVLKEFYDSADRHYLNLRGLGGIGKSHLIEHFLNTNKIRSILVDCTSAGLPDVLLKMGLPPSDSIAAGQQILTQIRTSGLLVVLDDVYELRDTEEVRKLQLALANIPEGKVIAISRSKLRGARHGQDHELGFLPEADFTDALAALILRLNDQRAFHFKPDPKVLSRIFQLTNGWLLAGEFVIRILERSSSTAVDGIIGELHRFNDRHVDDGRPFTKRILGDFFAHGKEDKKAFDLLFQTSFLSEPFGEFEANLLPNYTMEDWNRLLDLELVWKMPNGYKIHAFIKEFCYSSFSDQAKADMHLTLGKKYEKRLLNDSGRSAIRSISRGYQQFSLYDNLSTEDSENQVEGFARRILQLLPRRGDVMDLIQQMAKEDIQVLEVLIPSSGFKYLNYRHQMAIRYRTMRDHQKAIKLLEQIVDSDERNVKSMTELGRTYRDHTTDYQTAMYWYERALKISEGNPYALLGLGVLCRDKLNNYSESIRWLLQGASFNKRDRHIMNELGITYRQMGELDESVKWLKKILTEDKRNPHALSELGKTYRQLGDADQSIKYFRMLEEDEGRGYFATSGLFYTHLLLKNDTLQAQNCIEAVEGSRYRKRMRIHLQAFECIISGEKPDDLELSKIRKLIVYCIHLRANEQVIDYCNRLLNFFPNDPWLYQTVGVTISGGLMKQYARSRPYLIKAIALYEQDKKTTRNANNLKLHYLKGLVLSNDSVEFLDKAKRWENNLCKLEGYHEAVCNFHFYISKDVNELRKALDSSFLEMTDSEQKTSFNHYLVKRMRSDEIEPELILAIKEKLEKGSDN